MFGTEKVCVFLNLTLNSFEWADIWGENSWFESNGESWSLQHSNRITWNLVGM